MSKLMSVKKRACSILSLHHRSPPTLSLTLSLPPLSLSIYIYIYI